MHTYNIICINGIQVCVPGGDYGPLKFKSVQKTSWITYSYFNTSSKFRMLNLFGFDDINDMEGSYLNNLVKVMRDEYDFFNSF